MKDEIKFDDDTIQAIIEEFLRIQERLDALADKIDQMIAVSDEIHDAL